MYHDAAGKIDDTPLEEQSLRMPCHVCQGAVYDEEEKYHKEHICRKPHPLGKGTGDKRRGDDGKFHLKQGIESQGDRGTAQYVAGRSRINLCPDIAEHYEGQGIADYPTDVVAET